MMIIEACFFLDQLPLPVLFVDVLAVVTASHGKGAFDDVRDHGLAQPARDPNNPIQYGFVQNCGIRPQRITIVSEKSRWLIKSFLIKTAVIIPQQRKLMGVPE